MESIYLRLPRVHSASLYFSLRLLLLCVRSSLALSSFVPHELLYILLIFRQHFFGSNSDRETLNFSLFSLLLCAVYFSFHFHRRWFHRKPPEHLCTMVIGAVFTADIGLFRLLGLSTSTYIFHSYFMYTFSYAHYCAQLLIPRDCDIPLSSRTSLFIFN